MFCETLAPSLPPFDAFTRDLASVIFESPPSMHHHPYLHRRTKSNQQRKQSLDLSSPSHILGEMYNNMGPQPGMPMPQAVPQPNPFGSVFSGPGSGLIRTGLGAYGEKIFGSSSEYVQSNIRACQKKMEKAIERQRVLFEHLRPSSSSSHSVKILDPHPSVVATELLARKIFIDNGDQFNVIGCSWIQFMIHDWVDHLEDTHQIELKAPEEVANGCPLKSFKFFRTQKDLTGDHHKYGSVNTRTPWDGSVIYGNDEVGMRTVRVFKHGKLRISGDCLSEREDRRVPHTHN